MSASGGSGVNGANIYQMDAPPHCTWRGDFGKGKLPASLQSTSSSSRLHLSRIMARHLKNIASKHLCICTLPLLPLHSIFSPDFPRKSVCVLAAARNIKAGLDFLREGQLAQKMGLIQCR